MIGGDLISGQDGSSEIENAPPSGDSQVSSSSIEKATTRESRQTQQRFNSAGISNLFSNVRPNSIFFNFGGRPGGRPQSSFNTFTGATNRGRTQQQNFNTFRPSQRFFSQNQQRPQNRQQLVQSQSGGFQPVQSQQLANRLQQQRLLFLNQRQAQQQRIRQLEQRTRQIVQERERIQRLNQQRVAQQQRQQTPVRTQQQNQRVQQQQQRAQQQAQQQIAQQQRVQQQRAQQQRAQQQRAQQLAQQQRAQQQRVLQQTRQQQQSAQRSPQQVQLLNFIRQVRSNVGK